MFKKIHSKGRVLDLSTPIVMGILNATPDSFYNKGHLSDTQSLLLTAEKMLKEGAAILDVGGASTRPGQEVSDPEEEKSRVLPVIGLIKQHFPGAWVSVDTYHSVVAEAAVEAGADIVNDVSSGSIDPRMHAAVASLGAPYIAMHMQGTPKTMQVNPTYTDVVDEVLQYLVEVRRQCVSAGIKEVILDPGFGFGKTVEHNFSLLSGMHRLAESGCPVLAGLSRKSMICRPLKVNPDHALNGTTALNMVALQQGASILRVHDVREAAEVITLFGLLPRG